MEGAILVTGVGVRAISAALGCLAVTACTMERPTWRMAPFEGRPGEVFLFEDSTVVLDGVVWSFERSGEPVVFGGPVGFPREGEAAAVAIYGTGIELRTGADVSAAEPEEIRGLIAAAERYCEGTGQVVRRGGASLYTADGVLYVVRHCIPTRPWFGFDLSRG